jgi:nucleotide-binding universal stress UspA family protein
MDSVTGTGIDIVGIEHVLAPLDGSQHAETALHWLRCIPAEHITLFQACAPDTADRQRAEDYLREVSERFWPEGQAVSTRVANGCPADAIVDAAADANLVAMSTRGAGAGGRLLFGSVADRVARHSPAPALLIRSDATPNEMTFRRVIVPLDGSVTAERALPLAATFASALNCRMHIVSVDETADGAMANSSIGAYLERQAAANRTAGIEVSIEQRTGSPATELLTIVSPGDLLVLTTHGRGAARRWQIGSVAEKLLRQATAPVALVRADSS